MARPIKVRVVLTIEVDPEVYNGEYLSNDTAKEITATIRYDAKAAVAQYFSHVFPTFPIKLEGE